MTLCSYHVTYAFQSESTLYSCLNVKELLAQSRREIWSFSGCNWSVWLNSWLFVYELGGSGFESSCSHLSFRYGACFKQGVPWHSGNYRVWIHSEKRTRHTRTYSQMHRTDKYSGHSSIIWPVCLNVWVFVYELNGSGFESSCSHLNTFRACFEKRVSWHSGNYRVWVYSETRTWYDNNMPSTTSPLPFIRDSHDIVEPVITKQNIKPWKVFYCFTKTETSQISCLKNIIHSPMLVAYCYVPYHHKGVKFHFECSKWKS